jgi:hypothetical protein
MKAALSDLTRVCAAEGPTSACPILDAMCADAVPEWPDPRHALIPVWGSGREQDGTM